MTTRIAIALTTLSIALMTLALCAIGCGSYEGADYDGADDDAIAELGTAEQGLTSAINYGIEGQGPLVPCTVPWANSTCLVPQTRSPKFSESCTGCSQDMNASMGQAGSVWRTTLVSQGWAPSLVNPGAAGEYIHIDRGAVPGGESQDIAIQFQTVNVGSAPGPGGTYKKISHCSATVDLDKTIAYIAAHPPDVAGGCGAGTNCRLNMLQNQIKSALYLCVGIGKSTDRNSVSSGPHWAALSQDINTNEKSELNVYRP